MVPVADPRSSASRVRELPWQEAVARGVLLGGGAGLAASLADVASTVLWLAPGADRLRLALALPAIGFALSALLGGCIAAVYWALRRVVASTPTRHLLALTPALILVAHRLFSGGRMRRLPARWALQPLVAIVLVAAGALGVVTSLRVITAMRSRPRPSRNLASGLCVVLALALHGLDHRLLPRSYEYLHAGLGVLTALVFAAAIAIASPLPRRVVALGRAVGLVAVALGAFGFVGLGRWVNVRAEAFGPHAPFVRHGLVALATLSGDPEIRRPDPIALRRARFALTHTDDVPMSGDLPHLPGAHVLLITVDALRADRVGRRLLAGDSLTPTLDALAADAVVFDRAYAQAPHSSYSLSSLHTGEYLHETVPLGQPQPRPTLAAVLGASGFFTSALYTRGVFFTEGERLTAYRDRDFGFVRSVHVDRDASQQAAAAIDAIDDVVRRGEPPSLFWVHFFDAHAPYEGQGSTPEARYNDAVHTVDAAIGSVLAHARRTLARDLVVAVTADHGEEFGEHGGVYHGSTLYDEQVRVPLMIAAPHVRPRHVAMPVELVDLAPTLASLVGVSPSPTMRGRDLRPLMLADRPIEPVFAAVGTRKMVIRWPYKLITDVTYGVDEVYNLASDPRERQNLAGARPDLCASLHLDLSVWMDTLADAAPGDTSLARARLGDRGAAQGLVRLALSRTAPANDRVDAIRLLGDLAADAQIPLLYPLLTAHDPAVSAAAAVALGAAGDGRARARLVDLVAGDPPELRRATARSLARLGDERAVPGLVEALWSPHESESLDALRLLGVLGDPAAFEPVLTVLPDDHLRYRAVLALGQLHDRRAFDVLSDLALHDTTDDVRANAIAALGALGDRRAVPQIAATITLDRAERFAAEALGALGAIGRDVDGFDARTPDARSGFRACARHDDTLGWRYLGAMSCVSAGTSADVVFNAHGHGPRLLVLRLRRAGEGPSVPVILRLRGVEVARIAASSRWDESRIALPVFPEEEVHLALEVAPDASEPVRLQLDHLLALPLR